MTPQEIARIAQRLQAAAPQANLQQDLQFLNMQRIQGLPPVMPANMPRARIPDGFRGFNFNGLYWSYRSDEQNSHWGEDRPLAQFGRVWIYDSAIAIEADIAAGRIAEARAAVNALVQLGKDEQRIGFQGGWHFSYNTVGDAWVDPRAPMGGTLWAVKAICEYVRVGLLSDDARVRQEAREHLIWVNDFMRGLLGRMQVDRRGDPLDGLILAALENDNTGPGRKYTLDQGGYHAYEGNLNVVVRAAIAEHNADLHDALVLLAHAVTEAQLPDSERIVAELARRDGKLLDAMWDKFWTGTYFCSALDDRGRQMRGTDGRPTAAVDMSWVATCFAHYPDAEERLWQTVEYLWNNFRTKGANGRIVERAGQLVLEDATPGIQNRPEFRDRPFAGTSFLNEAFRDPFMDFPEAARPILGRMIQAEGCWGVVHFFIEFAMTNTRNPQRREEALRRAELLARSMTTVDEMYPGPGMPYATVVSDGRGNRVEFFTTLRSIAPSATGAIVRARMRWDRRGGEPVGFIGIEPLAQFEFRGRRPGQTLGGLEEKTADQISERLAKSAGMIQNRDIARLNAAVLAEDGPFAIAKAPVPSAYRTDPIYIDNSLKQVIATFDNHGIIPQQMADFENWLNDPPGSRRDPREYPWLKAGIPHTGAWEYDWNDPATHASFAFWLLHQVIHPFGNGNSRTGWRIMNVLRERAGLGRLPFTDDQDKYFATFNDNRNPADFMRFIATLRPQAAAGDIGLLPPRILSGAAREILRDNRTRFHSEAVGLLFPFNPGVRMTGEQVIRDPETREITGRVIETTAGPVTLAEKEASPREALLTSVAIRLRQGPQVGGYVPVWGRVMPPVPAQWLADDVRQGALITSALPGTPLGQFATAENLADAGNLWVFEALGNAYRVLNENGINHGNFDPARTVVVDAEDRVVRIADYSRAAVRGLDAVPSTDHARIVDWIRSLPADVSPRALERFLAAYPTGLEEGKAVMRAVREVASQQGVRDFQWDPQIEVDPALWQQAALLLHDPLMFQAVQRAPGQVIQIGWGIVLRQVAGRADMVELQLVEAGREAPFEGYQAFCAPLWEQARGLNAKAIRISDEGVSYKAESPTAPETVLWRVLPGVPAVPDGLRALLRARQVTLSLEVPPVDDPAAVQEWAFATDPVTLRRNIPLEAGVDVAAGPLPLKLPTGDSVHLRGYVDAERQHPRSGKIIPTRFVILYRAEAKERSWVIDPGLVRVRPGVYRMDLKRFADHPVRDFLQMLYQIGKERGVTYIALHGGAFLALINLREVKDMDTILFLSPDEYRQLTQSTGEDHQKVHARIYGQKAGAFAAALGAPSYQALFAGRLGREAGGPVRFKERWVIELWKDGAANSQTGERPEPSPVISAETIVVIPDFTDPDFALVYDPHDALPAYEEGVCRFTGTVQQDPEIDLREIGRAGQVPARKKIEMGLINLTRSLPFRAIRRITLEKKDGTDLSVVETMRGLLALWQRVPQKNQAEFRAALIGELEQLFSQTYPNSYGAYQLLRFYGVADAVARFGISIRDIDELIGLVNRRIAQAQDERVTPPGFLIAEQTTRGRYITLAASKQPVVDARAALLADCRVAAGRLLDDLEREGMLAKVPVPAGSTAREMVAAALDRIIDNAARAVGDRWRPDLSRGEVRLRAFARDDNKELWIQVLDNATGVLAETREQFSGRVAEGSLAQGPTSIYQVAGNLGVLNGRLQVDNRQDGVVGAEVSLVLPGPGLEEFNVRDLDGGNKTHTKLLLAGFFYQYSPNILDAVMVASAIIGTSGELDLPHNAPVVQAALIAAHQSDLATLIDRANASADEIVQGGSFTAPLFLARDIGKGPRYLEAAKEIAEKLGLYGFDFGVNMDDPYDDTGLEEAPTLAELAPRLDADFPQVTEQRQIFRFIADTGEGEPNVLRLLQLALYLNVNKGLRVDARGVATQQELDEALAQMPDDGSRRLLKDLVVPYDPAIEGDHERALKEARDQLPGLDPEMIFTDIDRVSIGTYLEAIQIMGVLSLSRDLQDVVEAFLTSA